VGGTHQTISIRFKIRDNIPAGSEFVAPGHYEITNKFLKKSPSAIIGNERRQFATSGGTIGPGPDVYNGQRQFSDTRSTSKEKNAPRVYIGKANERDPPVKDLNAHHPGPMTYNTNKTLIGGDSSIKAVIPMAVRPISAKPGQIKRIDMSPGPADYETVNVDKYLKRSRVIPMLTFSTQGKNSKSMEKLELRSKSPGPQAYRPKSATILRRSPTVPISR